jgi:ribosomal protein S18 acetylase RimI-like enzyme
MIRPATEKDIPHWNTLIKEVEPLFGKMLDDQNFVNAIQAAIKANIVFCHDDEITKNLDGAIVVNRDENSIEWLAVSSCAKGHGVGSKLVKKALSELDSNKDVRVQTFSSNIPEGLPARKLYEKFGFKDYQPAGKNPAGIDTVIMIKKCCLY